jgi:hypothetical protein
VLEEALKGDTALALPSAADCAYCEPNLGARSLTTTVVRQVPQLTLGNQAVIVQV